MGTLEAKSFVRGRKIDPPGAPGRVFELKCTSCGHVLRCMELPCAQLPSGDCRKHVCFCWGGGMKTRADAVEWKAQRNVRRPRRAPANDNERKGTNRRQRTNERTEPHGSTRFFFTATFSTAPALSTAFSTAFILFVPASAAGEHLDSRPLSLGRGVQRSEPHSVRLERSPPDSGLGATQQGYLRRLTYKVSFLGGRVTLDLRFRGPLEAKSFVRGRKIDSPGKGLRS